MKYLFLFVVLFSLSSCRKDESFLPKGMKPVDVDSIAPYSMQFSKAAEIDKNKSAMLTIWNKGVAGTFVNPNVKGKDSQKKIAYRYFLKPGAKSGIVLLPGRSEAMIKYQEVILDLWNQGFSIYVISHRGQGESDHLLSDPQIGHIGGYRDTVSDLNYFLKNIVTPVRTPFLFMLAHSMGGAIGALYLKQSYNPVGAEYENHSMIRFDGVVLSSPMMSINTAPFPDAVASTISNDGCNSNKNESWGKNQHGYKDNLDFNSADDNGVTHSEERFKWKVDLMNQNSSLKIGGVSYGWLCNWVGQGTKVLQNRDKEMGQAKDNLAPTLLFRAGNDVIVNIGPQENYCNDASQCRMYTVAGASHELMMETDDIRDLTLSRAVKFFNYLAK